MSYRKLIINDETWQYKIGKYNVLLICPDQIRWILPQNELLGLSWEVIERYRWKNKGEDHAANITPQKLRDYIVKTRNIKED